MVLLLWTLAKKKLWCRSTLVEEMVELHDSHIGGKLGEEDGAAAVGVGVTIESDVLNNWLSSSALFTSDNSGCLYCITIVFYLFFCSCCTCLSRSVTISKSYISLVEDALYVTWRTVFVGMMVSLQKLMCNKTCLYCSYCPYSPVCAFKAGP